MTDEERFRYLAGCGKGKEPVIEGFVHLDHDFYDWLYLAQFERLGEEADTLSPDEATDEDKLTAFRNMVDAAILEENSQPSTGMIILGLYECPDCRTEFDWEGALQDGVPKVICPGCSKDLTSLACQQTSSELDTIIGQEDAEDDE